MKIDFVTKIRGFMRALERYYLWGVFILACAFGAYVWYTSLYLLGTDEVLLSDLMNKDIFIDLDEKRFEEYSKMIDDRMSRFGSDEGPKTDIFDEAR